jgi:replicative DNA helicase
MNDRYCYSQNLAPDQTDRQSEEKKNPVFESPIQILERKNPEFAYVRTGISLIDRNVRGLQKGGLSIWSGLRGSAKSTLLTEILLNAIDDGNKALLGLCGYFTGSSGRRHLLHIYK